jgi:hypothetical protein
MCRVTASKLYIKILKIQSSYTKNITLELKNISVVLVSKNKNFFRL